MVVHWNKPAERQAAAWTMLQQVNDLMTELGQLLVQWRTAGQLTT